MPSTTRPVVLVLHPLPPSVMRELERSFVVRRGHDDRASPADLARHAGEIDGLVPTVTDHLPAAAVEALAPRLRIVANYGVGVERIDVAAARRAGVVVTNTPDVLTDCTADLTLALILMTMRRLGEGERMVRAGRWSGWRPTGLLGRRVTGCTLGLVGMGRIGKAVARRAGGFGMRILYHTRTPLTSSLARTLGAEPRELDDLLASADIVSLHCPLTPETHGLLNARRLASMRPDAVVINTARGALIDEAALVAALAAGRLGGAGLDVFAHEPEVPPALCALDTVVVLPHLGSATVETRVAMGMRVVDNLRAFFAGQPPPDLV